MSLILGIIEVGLLGRSNNKGVLVGFELVGSNRLMRLDELMWIWLE